MSHVKNIFLHAMLLLFLLIPAVTAYAQGKYPVKLTFGQADKQAVRALLNTPGTPGIIAHIWQKAHAEFHAEPPAGKIAKYDLNGDGVDEVFLYLYGHGFCGRGGCHLIIFQFNGVAQKLEYKTARSSSDDILIVNSRTEEHHNLAIRLPGGGKNREKDVKGDSGNFPGEEDYTLYDWQDGNLIQTDKTILFQPEELQCE